MDVLPIGVIMVIAAGEMTSPLHHGGATDQRIRETTPHSQEKY
jgi:hypothetical protein